MKKDPVRKMYASLSPHDLARVAFGHLMAGNESEVEKVIDSVPYKNYRCKDLEFQDQFEAYKTMAFLWAIEYWQVYAMHLESIIKGMPFDDEKMKMKCDLGIIKKKLSESQILSALDRVLESICDAQGIDHLVVREMAGAKLKSAAEADEDYAKMLRLELEKIIIW